MRSRAGRILMLRHGMQWLNSLCHNSNPWESFFTFIFCPLCITHHQVPIVLPLIYCSRLTVFFSLLPPSWKLSILIRMLKAFCFRIWTYQLHTSSCAAHTVGESELESGLDLWLAANQQDTVKVMGRYSHEYIALCKPDFSKQKSLAMLPSRDDEKTLQSHNKHAICN